MFTNISFGSYDSSTIARRISRNEDRATWLYVNAFDLAIVNTQVMSEGLQIAIWDIIHDGGDGPNQGRIQASVGTPLDVVQSWGNFLVSSQGQSSPAASIYLNSIELVPCQTLIGVLQPLPPPAPTGENVPEPGSLGLLAVGFTSLAFARKYSNNRKRY